MAYEGDINPHFDIGSRALLVFMGQRFLVSILESESDALLVSYPVSDFPIEGMAVTLEFHDETGFATYETEVLRAARQVGDGLLLQRPPEMVRTHHRHSWRVPADFRVEIKDHVHPRRTETPAINISAGGMLIRTLQSHDVGDNVDIHFRLPGDNVEQSAVGQVVHKAPVPDARDGACHVGVKFVGADPVVSKCISNYIWRRLRELNPNEARGGWRNV